MPALVAALISLNIVLFVLLVSGHGHGILGFTELKSVDLATIGLMAATLVLTGVGVLVAIITFVGYREIKASSIRAARETANRVAMDIATSVATRIALETKPTETTAEDAARIAQAENGPAGHNWVLSELGQAQREIRTRS